MYTQTTLSSSSYSHQEPTYHLLNQEGPFLITKFTRDSSKQNFSNFQSWKNDETSKYIAYLSANSEELENNANKKLWSSYKKMSSFIKTRNFRQCKMYHQKLKRKIGKINKIIEHLCQTNSELNEMVQSEHEQYQKFLRKTEERLRKGEQKNNEFKTAVSYEEDEEENELKEEEEKEEKMGLKKDNFEESMIGSQNSFLAWIKRFQQFQMKELIK